jgi:acrosin
VVNGNYVITDPGASINVAGAQGWTTNNTAHSASGSIPSTATIVVDVTANSNNAIVNVQSISNATTIDGNSGNDTFNVSSNAPANTGNLSGIKAALTVNAGAGKNALNVSNFSASSGDSNVVVSVSTITGFAPATITYNGTYNLVRIIGSNSPTLAENFTINNPGAPFQLDANAGPDTANVQALSFAAILNMGAGDDTVNVSSTTDPTQSNLDSIKASLSIDGGTGSNVLNVSDYASSGNSNVTITPTSISGLAGTDASPQTITYRASAGTFSSINVDGSDSGTDVFNISGKTAVNINGNGGDDQFNFVTPGATAGKIDGGGGNDTLSYAGYTSPVDVVLGGSDSMGYFSSSAPGVVSFSGIDNLIGGKSGSDELTGENVVSTWNLGSTDTYSDGSNTLTFSGFETLQGGSGADTFNVNAPTTANLLGGAGDDTFNVSSALTGRVDGQGGSDTLSVGGDVALTGSGSTGFSGTNANVSGGFTGINVVNDTTSGTLTGEDVDSTWVLDSSQTYNDGSNTLTFSGFGTLQGGAGADTFNVTSATTANLLGGAGADTFNISAALIGSVDGQGDSDTLNVGGDVTLTGSGATGFSGSNSNISGGFAGIDALNNTASTGALTGENVDSTWNLGSSQTYNDGAGVLAFSGYSTLQGGSGADTFNVNVPTTANLLGGAGDDVFNVNATLTGMVDGQPGSDTLSVGGDVALTGSGSTGFSGSNSNISDGFAGIDALNNTAATGTLTGENVDSTWNLGSTETYSDGAGVLAFSGYSTLQGGSGADTFNVNAPTSTNLMGGAGDDVFNVNATLTGMVDGQAGSDTLNVNGDVTLTSSDATGFAGTNASLSDGFAGIDVLNGSGTLTGEDVTSLWVLDSSQTYSDGSSTLTFSGFGTLQGGAGADSFDVTSATTANLLGGAGADTFNISAALIGSVDGQGDSDTLNVGGDVTLTVSDATGFSGSNSNVSGGFAGIDTLNNTDGTGALTGENVDSTWDLGGSQTYNDGSQTLIFSGYSTLNGGSAQDTFNVTQTAPGVSLTLNGNAGDNSFNVSNLDNVQGNVTIDGGSGSNTLAIDDSAKTSSVSWTIESSDVQRENAGTISYSNMATVDVTVGAPTDGFSNAIDVESTPSGVAVTLDASGGNSDIVVSQVANNLDAIQGDLTLVGASTDTITINDQANINDTNYVVSDTGVTRDAAAAITLSGGAVNGEQLVVLGGSGANVFDVTPSINMVLTVDGGSGTDSNGLPLSTLNYHTNGSTTYGEDGTSITDVGMMPVFYSNFGTVNYVNP